MSAGNPAWTSHTVSLRLGKRRLALMRALAASMPQGATPTEVVDRALEEAAARERSDEDRMADLEDAMERYDMARRREIDRVEAAVLELSNSVASLRELIEGAMAANEAAPPP